jgi:hypothetical protein
MHLRACRQHQHQGRHKLEQTHKTEIPGTGGDVVHVPGDCHHQHLVGTHPRKPGKPEAHELTVGK